MLSSGYSGIPGAPGNPGMFNNQSIAQRVYGPIEKGMHNRSLRFGVPATTPDVYMAPYPGRVAPGAPTEYFPLGNPAAGFNFQSAVPGMNEEVAGGNTLLDFFNKKGMPPTKETDDTQINKENKGPLRPGAFGNPNLYYHERFTPLATTGGGMSPMGNASFFYGPQYGQDVQQLPIGFGGISIS